MKKNIVVANEGMEKKNARDAVIAFHKLTGQPLPTMPKLPKNKCCICAVEFEGFGNNPAPFKYEGVCCDACNCYFVMPARFEAMGF